MNQYDISKVFASAYLKVETSQNLVSTFQSSLSYTGPEFCMIKKAYMMSSPGTLSGRTTTATGRTYGPSISQRELPASEETNYGLPSSLCQHGLQSHQPHTVQLHQVCGPPTEKDS